MDTLQALGTGLFLIGLVVLIILPTYLNFQDSDKHVGISLGNLAIVSGMALLLVKAYQDRLVADAEEAGDEDMQRKN